MEEQKTKVVLVGSTKSQGVAFILIGLFGPLGLFYATMLGGFIMLFISIPLGIITGGLSMLVIWPICVIWGIISVFLHNRKIKRGI